MEGGRAGGRRHCIYACGAAVAARAICVRSVIVTQPLNRHIMLLRERESGGGGGTEIEMCDCGGAVP